MDVKITRWILEYLLRQPLDDAVLSPLLLSLPVSEDDAILKKTLLLRKIESEISNGSVSECILEYLERIEELEFIEGIEPADSMKSAYCSTAVDCTVRFLKCGDDEKKRWRYFDAVRRIWRGRVCKMQRGAKVGLGSEELRSWKEDVEAAVWEESACDGVLRRSQGNDAVGAVRAYVWEAYQRTGPPFLELVADTLENDEDTVAALLGRRCNQKCGGDGGKSAPSPTKSRDESNAVAAMIKRSALPRRKYVACKRPRKAPPETSRGAKISDVDDTGADSLCKKDDFPATLEVDIVTEEPQSSNVERQDPTPEATKIADAVNSVMHVEKLVHGPDPEIHDRTDPPVEDGFPVSNDGMDPCNGCSSDQHAFKPSLMDRNKTAQTQMWDDSTDSLSEGSLGQGRSNNLPSQVGMIVAPLRQYPQKVSKRRKNRRWSLLEEDTLRTGVEKFGVGNWKLILGAYRDIFEERTEVDLKDKWRNMKRYI